MINMHLNKIEVMIYYYKRIMLSYNITHLVEIILYTEKDLLLFQKANDDKFVILDLIAT